MRRFLLVLGMVWCFGCNNQAAVRRVDTTNAAYEACVVEGKTALLNGWNSGVQGTNAVPNITSDVCASGEEKLRTALVLSLWNVGKMLSHDAEGRPSNLSEKKFQQEVAVTCSQLLK